MTGIQPELWVDRTAAAVAFYGAALGARVLHQVGEGDDIVAQLAVGDAAFWVSPGGADGPRFSPGAIGGATGRTLLVVDDPDALFARAVAAGATVAAEMADEHGWRLGRIFDPFGHEWEIGRPLGHWPPASASATADLPGQPHAGQAMACGAARIHWTTQRILENNFTATAWWRRNVGHARYDVRM